MRKTTSFGIVSVIATGIAAAIIVPGMAQSQRVTAKNNAPLKAAPDYEPLARGMAAALPHVDHFLAGNSLASLAQLADLARELARERTAGAARRRLGAGIDQVGDRLGLRQVDLVVQEGALGEFTRRYSAGKRKLSPSSKRTSSTWDARSRVIWMGVGIW